MSRFPTIESLKQSACAALNPGIEKTVEQKKKSKHRNEIIEFDGKIFRSKKELGRFVALRMLVTAGEITDLQTQVPFELNENGSHSMKYVADFIYKIVKTGEVIVEDSKGGPLTKLFQKKAKLLKRLFGITIKVVRN